MRCGLVILLGLAAVGCDGAGTPTEPIREVIGLTQPRAGLVAQSGRVLDFATDSPIPGARVVFQPFDTGEEYAAVADAGGVYRLEVPPGEYVVRVDGQGATALAARVPSARGHVYTGAEGCSAIYGLVGDSRSGAVIQGVIVQSGAVATMTGADGWYRLDYGCGVNGGFGTMVANFSKAGYEAVTRVVGRGLPSGARRIDVGLLRPREGE